MLALRKEQSIGQETGHVTDTERDVKDSLCFVRTIRESGTVVHS